jgi:hypothetical protein
VKVGEANEEYARKMGIVGRELTDAEKKMAFYQAAMEAARRKTAELGEQSKTLGEIIDSVWVSIGNSVTSAVSDINVGIGSAISSMKNFGVFLANVQRMGFGAAVSAQSGFEAGRNAPPRRDTVLPSPHAAPAPDPAATRRLKDAADAYAKSIKSIADILSGQDLTRKVKELSDAFQSLGDARNTPVVIKNTADAALKLLQAGAKLTPELFNVVIESGRLSDLLPAMKVGLDATALGFENVTGDVKGSVEQFSEFAAVMNSLKFTEGIEGLKNIGQAFTLAIPEPLPPTFWDKFFDVKGPSLAQSARFAADSVIGSLAEGIRTGNWAQFKAQLRDSFSQFAGSAIAAGVNLLVPGLGTLLQPLFAALTDKLIGLFDRNKGRDLVESFAEGFGGFDELHKQLNLLGDEGEELWKKLTQGVGRNNPTQAAAAIAEVEAALAKYKRTQDIATVSTEEGAQATIETAAQAAIALDQLNDRLKVNAQAWSDWSVDVTGFLQKLADDIRALPLPGPTGLMGGSTGGARPRVSFTGRGGGETTVVPVGSLPSPESGSTTVILEMDSYAVAEAVVPQIPGVVQRYGLADV